MKMFRIGIVAALALALVLPAAATAQDTAPWTTWVFLYKAKPDKGDQLVDLIKTHFGKEIESQIAAGTILGWGIASRSNYDGGYTHVEWVSHPNWTAMASSEESFEGAWEAMEKAEKEAIRRSFDEVLEERPHNRVIRTVVRRAEGWDRPPKYLVMGEYRARPGKWSAGTALYKEFVPIYEKLADDGEITGYGMAVPALHDKGGWSHWTWIALERLAGMDAVDAALSDYVTEEFDARRAEIFDPAGHHDQLWRILHLSGPEPE